jgi:predicted PurR-regulated permease PerM
MTRQLLIIGTAVMVTVLGLLLLWQFHLVAVYFIFSLALAATIRPLGKHLSGHKLPIRLGLIALVLLLLVSFVLLLVLTIGAAAGEVRQLANHVSSQDEWRQPDWLTGTSLQTLLDERLPPPSALLGALTGDQGQLVLPTLLGFSQGIISVASAALIILFLSIYWSIDQVHFERLWLSLLPATARGRVRDIWRAVEQETGAYIRNEAVRSLLAGLLLGLGYWLLGSPYPALLALIGALALLVPMVGVAVAVIAPLLVGLLTSVQLALFTGLYTIVVLIALKRWVEPRLFKHGQFNPIVTIVILIALADAIGLLGIIVAPPLSAALQILWGHLISHRAVSGAAAQLSDLQARHARLAATIQAMDEPPPLMTSSLDRITGLLAEAEPVLKEAV